MIRKYFAEKIIKRSLLNSQILGAFLIFLYCAVYGISAQIVLAGMQMVFFLASLVFALSVVLIKDPEIQKQKVSKGILVNQLVGTILVFTYILVFGISSIALLTGFQLVFFMSSYVFAMSLFYIKDKDRAEKVECVSSSSTHSQFREISPCFINSQDVSWMIRELNECLSTIIGFCELMLNRDYNQAEKEFMLRNIYEQGLNMSNLINKVAQIMPDKYTKPREIHEVVNLLDDKNFK